MNFKKILYAAPVLLVAVFFSDYAFTKLNNFSYMNRAWDVVGPGMTTRKDCSSCHAGGTTVTQDSAHRIFIFGSGLRAYKPDSVYTISYKLIATGPVGFSSTVLRNDSNTMAGTLMATDTNETKVYLHTASGRSYMNHREGQVTGGVKEYTFKWKAPAKGTGTVTFYFSSLSSNNDDATSDDSVFNNTWIVSEAPVSSSGLVQKISGNASVLVYPNPASDRIHISFVNGSDGATSISLTSIDGKQHAELMNEQLSRGAQELNLLIPANLQAGIYFLRIGNDQMSHTEKILVQ